MRQTISGWVAGTIASAALAVTVGVAPASACQAVDPCGGGYNAGVAYGVHHEGYAERLPDPHAPQQYYYANQGPTYTGPGNLAPEGTYDERFVVRPQSYYHHRYYHRRYHGGPYANPLNHHYYGAPRVHGPVVYTYRPRAGHFRPHRSMPYYAQRYGVRPGYAPRFYGPKPYAHGPRQRYVPRYAAPRPPVMRNSAPGPVPMPAPNPKPQI